MPSKVNRSRYFANRGRKLRTLENSFKWIKLCCTAQAQSELLHRIQEEQASTSTAYGQLQQPQLTPIFQFKCCTESATIAENNLFSSVELAKCLVVISMSYTYQNETIAQKMKLSLPIIEKILKYKDHIQNIFKYIPETIGFIRPDKLNMIIAITEILKEFMWRLMRHNVKITDEELMMNANLLKKAFCVTGLQIDNQWTQFFRKNFEQSNPIEDSIKKIDRKDFYVRNILQHVQDRLDSKVITLFNKYLKKINSDDLILVCSKLVEKDISRKQISKATSKIKTVSVDEECLKTLEGSNESEQDKINNTESGKTSKPTKSGEQSLQKENSSVTAYGIYEFKGNPQTTMNASKKEPQEFVKTEEIEVEKCISIVNDNELMNKSPALCMHEENEFEEYMTNDDSNEMIEIYAVIDEYDNDNNDDDNDNDKHLIVIDKQSEKTSSTVDTENDNPEYTATKAGLNLKKIKKKPIVELQSKQFPTQYWNIGLTPLQPEINQVPNETNIRSENNENYRGRKEFEELQVMQSSIQIWCVEPEINKDDHDDVEKSINLDEQTKTNLSIFNETQYKMNQVFYVKQENENPECIFTETEFDKYSQELPLVQIKEEIIEVNANGDMRQEDKVFEEPQAMQSPKHFYVESEIKQEPNETNDNVDNNENNRGLEEFNEPQTMQYSIQKSSVEPEIKQEPDETNSNTDSNDNYSDREEFEELKEMQSPIRNLYEETMEPEAALEQNTPNINSDKNDSNKTYAVISENYNENSMILEKQTETNLETSNETQHKANQDYYIKQKNKNLKSTATEAEFYKYSQELSLDQIKEEFIEINANESIREEENVFEVSHVVQSPTQISCVEATDPEINQPTEAIADFDKIERDKDNEVLQDPQAIEFIIQRKYILPMEHEIKQEPVEAIVNPYQLDASSEYENLNTTPEYLNVELHDNVQRKEHQKDEKRNEIVTSYDILRNDTAITLKNGDHLKEQRALDIAKIFRSKPYGQLCCDTLSLDPIIFTYIYIMSNEPKLIREQALRMSFQIVLGEELYNCQYQYSIQPEDLELYRQFVLLLYSTKHRLFQLKHIMKGIFNESEIKVILNNSYHILEEWRTFFKKHFISMLYRKAMFEILFEYRTRHNLISAALDRNAIEALPQTTMKDIQQFLHSDFELEENWLQRYNAYIRKKGNNPNVSYRLFTTTDLSLNRIYADIKERLPQIVVENLCYFREEGDMWNVNNNASKSSKAVDRLNLKDSNLQEKNLIIQNNQNDKIYSKPIITQDWVRKLRENIIEASMKEPPNKKPKIDQFMDTDLQKTSNEIQSVEESINSEISTTTDLLSRNACDDNPAETKEIANIKKIQIWDKTHFICTLHNDPIIASYLSCSRLGDKKNFPEYSASTLQKAFEMVFKENNIGKYSVCQPQDFQLYTKLLLLYYASHTSHYKKRIGEIMTCFDTKTMQQHMFNSANIITKWRTFFNKNISRLLYKQAIYEMLYEYTRRYLKKEKAIFDEVLIQTAAEIQRFLRCNIILPEQWLENFSAMFARRFGFYKYSNKCDLFNRIHTNLSTNNSTILTGNYMDYHSIYKYVKYRLNFLVTDTLSGELESVHNVDIEKSLTSTEINANDNEVDVADEKLMETKQSIDVFIKKQLAEDPIIIKFFQLSKEKTPAGTRLPIFTEDLLRLSFNEVLKNCRMRPVSYDDFHLYRQLILFKYSEQCSSVDELAEIMKCFTVSAIGQHFRNYLNIIQKWHKVNENLLAVYIFQQALFEMLFEYARRLLRINPYVQNYWLIEKFEEMKDFFDLHLKLPTKRHFYNILLKNFLIIKTESKTSICKDTDLDLETIYESIKSRLHSFVIKKRDATVTARKKFKRIVKKKKRTYFSQEKKKKIAENKKNERTIHRFLRKTITVLNRKRKAQDSGENMKVQNVDKEEISAKESNKKVTSNMDSFKEVKLLNEEVKINEVKFLNDDISDATDIDELTSIGDCDTEEIIEQGSDDEIKVQKIYSGHKRKHQKNDDTITETQNNRILNQTEATTSKYHEKLEKSDEIISILSDSESNDEEEIEIIFMSDDA